MKKKNFILGENIHDNVHLNQINWFPGHMNKAIKKIKERLTMVDIVLEIRDARSPLVTGNKVLNQQIRQKAKLIVINKTNLANPKIIKLWNDWFTTQNHPFCFINCFDKASMNLIIKQARKVVDDKIRQSNPDHSYKKKLRIMIIGLPNTGKSTIINRLAKRNATKVADRPGQTRQQLWVKIDNDTEILDTPGIMPPKIDKHEHGLWLASLHAIPEKIVEADVVGNYILEYLIKEKSIEFQKRYQLDATDLERQSIVELIAKNRGFINKGNIYDHDRVYKTIISDFRNGLLGKVSFGIPPK